MAKKSVGSVCSMFFWVILSNFLLSTMASMERNGSSPAQVCGQIQTIRNHTVTLLDNIALTPEEFENVHHEKLKGAVFSPVPHCAINLCGFASYGVPYEDNYIGTTSDYSDCALYESETAALTEIYIDNYNTSSISCGCIKNVQECTYNCPFRASKQKWKGQECAVLFQERSCNSCYFPPTYLFNNETISSNYSLQFTTMIVRDNCFVEQKIPAFSRMWRFHNLTQPFIYLPGPTENDIASAWQDQPETFRCLCDVPVPVVPGSSTDSLHRNLGLSLVIMLIPVYLI